LRFLNPYIFHNEDELFFYSIIGVLVVELPFLPAGALNNEDIGDVEMRGKSIPSRRGQVQIDLRLRSEIPLYGGREALQAVLVGADVVELAGAAVGLRIAFEVAVEAHHLAFEERRAAVSRQRRRVHHPASPSRHLAHPLAALVR